MVSDEQVSALHAALTGDATTFDQLIGASALDHGQGFAVLISAAFICAAQRRFTACWSKSAVIRFVGQLRARDQGDLSDVNADVAEKLLIRALGGEPLRDIRDSGDQGYAQAAVLAELVADLDMRRLGSLLCEAREVAEWWLTSSHCG
jgi:hypothetical protein